MSEIKKYGPDKRDSNLKREDKKKLETNTGVASAHNSDLFGGKKLTDKAMGPDVKVKRKLPLIIDIIAGILILAIVCGVVVGSYMLFRHYANDYDSKNIVYTITFRVDKDINKYASIKGTEVYLDSDGSTEYFGKINESRLEKDSDVSGNVIVTIEVSARYRVREGYSIGETRIAVGSVHNLRCGDKEMSEATIVEITESGGK
ncbi:MAG: hypothetical protein E7611_05365 [Ruminococcaceae bacterium]|nr:hypothetical protein [Oscillospiraceae bacterium]